MADFTQFRRAREGPTLLDAALKYAGFGWLVFPLRAREKRPWTRNGFKAGTTDPAKIRRWWKQHPDANIGVVTGAASGIVVIDIDPRNGGDRSFKELAGRLGELPPGPVVITGGGGRHYFFRYPGRPVKKPSGDAPGVDVKADGGYIVGVGSIHESGKPYTWQVKPDGAPLPGLPEAWLDWLRACHATEEHRRAQKNTEEHRGVQKSTEAVLRRPFCFSISKATREKEVEAAIVDSLPVATGQRNRQVFNLARAIKGIPALADAPPDGFRCHVRRWHKMGIKKGVIKTEPFEETWIDFLKCWPKVQHPKGSIMAAIVKKAKQSPTPKAAMGYEQPGLRMLTAVCRELQGAAGVEPFYLACRTAGRLAGVDHSTAARWLWLLVHDGILQEVEKGDRGRRRASRYRYLGDDATA